MAQLKSTNITGSLSVTGDVVASKLSLLGGSDTKVLLAGGGTKDINDFADDSLRAEVIALQGNVADIMADYATEEEAQAYAAGAALAVRGINDTSFTVKGAYDTVSALSAVHTADYATLLALINTKLDHKNNDITSWVNSSSNVTQSSLTIGNVSGDGILSLRRGKGQNKWVNVRVAEDVRNLVAGDGLNLYLPTDLKNPTYNEDGTIKEQNHTNDERTLATRHYAVHKTGDTMSGTLNFANNDSYTDSYAINAGNQYIHAERLHHTSVNFGSPAFDSICVNHEGWIYYRTKEQFIQDLSLSQVYNYKGTITWANLLALTEARVGEVYYITDTDAAGKVGQNWACKQAFKDSAIDASKYATYWSSLGNYIDLSGYVTKDTTQAISGQKTFSNTVTFTNQVLISNTNDVTTSSSTGALRIGNVSAEHLALDGNEIMARNGSAVSTLYLNNEGGLVQIGSGGLTVNDTGYFDNDIKIKGHVFAYNYDRDGNNAPALIFDKSGGNYTGIGSIGVNDTIYFGAVTSDEFQWNKSYQQKWRFNGEIQLSDINDNYGIFKYNTDDKCIDITFS